MAIVAIDSGDVVVVRDEYPNQPLHAEATNFAAKINEVVEDKKTERLVLASIVNMQPNADSPAFVLLHFIEKGAMG